MGSMRIDDFTTKRRLLRAGRDQILVQKQIPDYQKAENQVYAYKWRSQECETISFLHISLPILKLCIPLPDETFLTILPIITFLQPGYYLQ